MKVMRSGPGQGAAMSPEQPCGVGMTTILNWAGFGASCYEMRLEQLLSWAGLGGGGSKFEIATFLPRCKNLLQFKKPAGDNLDAECASFGVKLQYFYDVFPFPPFWGMR